MAALPSVLSANLLSPRFSTENVDMVGRREHFLKSNFESLSGGVEDNLAVNNSISNKYKSGGLREQMRYEGV